MHGSALPRHPSHVRRCAALGGIRARTSIAVPGRHVTVVGISAPLHAGLSGSVWTLFDPISQPALASALDAILMTFAQALDPHEPPARGLQYSDLFLELQAAAPFFLMAGPNVIQSEAHCMKMCRQVWQVRQHISCTRVSSTAYASPSQPILVSCHTQTRPSWLHHLYLVPELVSCRCATPDQGRHRLARHPARV